MHDFCTSSCKKNVTKGLLSARVSADSSGLELAHRAGDHRLGLVRGPSRPGGEPSDAQPSRLVLATHIALPARCCHSGSGSGPVCLGWGCFAWVDRPLRCREARSLVLCSAGAVVSRERRRVRSPAADRLRPLALAVGDHARPAGRPAARDAAGPGLRRGGRPLVAAALHDPRRHPALRRLRRHRLRGFDRADAGARARRRLRDGPLRARRARLAARPGRAPAAAGGHIRLRRDRRPRLHRRAGDRSGRAPLQQPGEPHDRERPDLRRLGARARGPALRRDARERGGAPALAPPGGARGPDGHCGHDRDQDRARRVRRRALLRGRVQRGRASVR